MAPAKDTTATLNYHLDPSEGGTEFFYVGTVGEKRRKHAPVKTKIQDIRGADEEIKIDTHGFQLVNKPSIEKAFDNDERIKSDYYAECAELIKEITGATDVKVSTHIVRRQSWNTAFEAEKDLDDLDRSKGPSTANFVHIDQSYTGARALVQKTTPEDLPRLDHCRWAIINLWRPIANPVTRWALTMCDARSIRDDELAEVMVRFPKNDMSDEDKENKLPNGARDPYQLEDKSEAGSWSVRPPKKAGDHKWWYASEMKPEECLLLKIFDSKEKGVARRAPHTGFVSPEDHGPERQSLEVRCLCLWEDKPAK